MAWVKYWLIPDVGGWVPFVVCLVVITGLTQIVAAPGVYEYLLSLAAWITAMVWYRHWRRG